jgi:ADP-heptose:LPS heptosyltransferase
MRISLPSAPRRILIIKPSAIGDVVHALPTLNLIRRKWPDSHITWMIAPACAALVDRHRQVNEVLRFERNRFSASWYNPAVSLELYRFVSDLKRRQYDLVIDLQCLFRSGWMTLATRAPVRVGLGTAREGARYAYTHVVPDTFADQAVDRYLKVADALGCGTSPVEFHFAVDDEDRAMVTAILREAGIGVGADMSTRDENGAEGGHGEAGADHAAGARLAAGVDAAAHMGTARSAPIALQQYAARGSGYAVLLPGTNWLTKRWPVEHYAAVVEPIRRRFGLTCVVAGAAGDRELACQVPGAVDLTGKTNLRQTIALLSGAGLVIANDSGPMHIAAALGRPLVAPYGPTSPFRTGPFGRLSSVIRVDMACSPCYSRTCSHRGCLKWLSPEAVLNLAEQQITEFGQTKNPAID